MTQDLVETKNAATSTSISLLSTESAMQTQVAVPTNTPLPTSTEQPTLTPVPTNPPPQTICNAQVAGTSRAMYPVPGQGRTYFNKLVEAGTNVKILGRIGDNNWYKVDVNGEQGWMKSDTLKLSNACRPTVYDLHYLSNWLSPDENLILDDTFSSNANVWIDTATQGIVLADTIGNESVLSIQADKERIVTTTNPRASDISAFKLYTSFSIEYAIDESYFGIRFRDSGSDYFQIKFTPSTCKLEIYATNALVYPPNLDSKTCIGRYYDVELALTPDYKLSVQINGFEPITVNLQDPDGRYGHGKIDFVVNKLNVYLNYVVITSPK